LFKMLCSLSFASSSGVYVFQHPYFVKLTLAWLHESNLYLPRVELHTEQRTT